MKTVAEHMRDILLENDYESVGYGDVAFLDECASRAKHTKLATLPTKDRHIQVINSLEKSPFFVKHLIIDRGRTVRHFWLKESNLI